MLKAYIDLGSTKTVDFGLFDEGIGLPDNERIGLSASVELGSHWIPLFSSSGL